MTKITVSREMAVNELVCEELVCEDINVGSLDLIMPSLASMMKKTWQQVDTRGRGSNDAGNDEDGGQQFRKWNKIQEDEPADEPLVKILCRIL